MKSPHIIQLQIKKPQSKLMKYKNKEHSYGDINKSKKRPWTDEEDLLVMKLVEENGPHKWTYIANHLPGRIGKQCRERWHNHLNPLIKKSPWEDYEEWLLFIYHKALENKWAEIAKHLVGRTDNSIKNHWNSGMKKRISEFQERLSKIKMQFQMQGSSSILNQVKDEIEKKALEIILLNKKYESLATDSEDDDLSDSKESVQKCHVLRPKDTNLHISNHSKPIKKRRNRYYHQYLKHLEQTSKQADYPLSIQKNSEVMQTNFKFTSQNDIENENQWSTTPNKLEKQELIIYNVFTSLDLYQTPAGFNKINQRVRRNQSSERYFQNNSFGKENNCDPYNQIIPMKQGNALNFVSEEKQHPFGQF